jgi:hypothetical protein
MPVIHGQQTITKNEPYGDIESFKKWFDLQNMDFAMVYIEGMWEVHAMHRISGNVYSGEPCNSLTGAIHSAYTNIMGVFKKEGIPLHANIRPLSES